MAHSINFYLDNAISEKSIQEIEKSSDKDAKRDLNKRISEKPLQIFVYLRYSGKTVKVYAERKCTQKQWDSGKQRVDPNYYKAGARELNTYLNNIADAIGRKYEENNNNGSLTNSDHIKTILYELNNKSEMTNGAMTFEKAYEEFIQVSKVKKMPSTITVYKTTLKHLKAFAVHSKIRLSFDNIDLKFDDALRAYFINKCGMFNNSVAKYIKTLKTFLNFCTDRGYNKKTIYLKFDATEREREVYALTVDQLMKMHDHKFDNEMYGKVRDVFCFACFTGLRYSDVMNLKRENIVSDSIRFTTIKTQENKEIPLNHFAKNILNKYVDDKKPLPAIASQDINTDLENIGKDLKFNEPVKFVKYKGSERIETYVPMHEVLTFHVSRKTFVTTSLVLGMDERMVKEFSGHKKEENFRRYVKFADTYKTKVMNTIWNEKSIKKAQK